MTRRFLMRELSPDLSVRPDAKSRAKVLAAFRSLRFDDQGLVPLIVQDWASGTVLAPFYANLQALEKLAETGFVWRFSRSEKKLMQKGGTSGNVQRVLSISLNCENNAVLAKVVPFGPACHNDTFSCFSDEIMVEGRRD